VQDFAWYSADNTRKLITFDQSRHLFDKVRQFLL